MMMEKLVKLVEAYYEQIGVVADFNKTVLTQLLKYYDSGIMNELLSRMKDMNDSQLEYVQYRKGLGADTEAFIDASVRVRKSNQALLSGVSAALFMEKTPEVRKYIQKAENSSETIIGYIDDIMRTYLVNIPDDIREQTIMTLKGETLDSVIESVQATVDAHPEDEYGKQLLERLKRQKEVEQLVEESAKQTVEKEDEKAY